MPVLVVDNGKMRLEIHSLFCNLRVPVFQHMSSVVRVVNESFVAETAVVRSLVCVDSEIQSI